MEGSILNFHSQVVLLSITGTERCTFVTKIITVSICILKADLTFFKRFGSYGSDDGQFNYMALGCNV